MVASKEVSECMTQAVLKVPSIHDHLVYEVKLLSFWLLANWPITCLMHRLFDASFVLGSIIVGFDLTIRVSQILAQVEFLAIV